MKHTVDSAISSLSRKRDCKIDLMNNEIAVLLPKAENRSNDMGNSSWGKVDFLLKKGFRLIRLSDKNFKKYLTN